MGYPVEGKGIDKSLEMDISEIQKKLSDILQERNRLFPERDERNDKEMEEALTEFVDQINNAQSLEFLPDASLTAKAEPILDSPLFLCGSMKSGTTLLLELLDNHPELITLPGDSYFAGRISKEDPPPLTLLDTAWDGWVKRMVNPTGQEPFWVFGSDIQPYVAFRQYLQYWYDKFPDSWRSSVVSVMLSYYCANPVRPTAPKVWVEKTPGNETRIAEIVKRFPGARFIHIVRDPRENMASLKKLYATRNWPWDPIGTAGTLSESCRLAAENQQQMGKEKYHVLSYEALTEDPGAQMKDIARFIDIQWSESLLRPTVNALPAHANSMYKDRQVTGKVGKSTEEKWRTVLTGSEQQVALGTLQGARRVGYDWQTTFANSVLLLFYRGWIKVKRSLVEYK